MSAKQKSKKLIFYEHKRIEAFNAIGTKPSDWKALSIFKYYPISYQVIKVKYPGNVYTTFKPFFKIPKDYKNAFNEDINQDDNILCQLCGHKIPVNFGILINPDKKLWLKVGIECYEKYENDDIKNYNRELFSNIKKTFYDELLQKEKNNLYEIVMKAAENKIKLQNKFYREVSRKRFISHTRRKFIGFLDKHIWNLIKLNYFPDKKLISTYKYKMFLRKYAAGKENDPLKRNEILKINSILELEKICGIEPLDFKEPFVVHDKYK